jgi:hypothetical protein
LNYIKKELTFIRFKNKNAVLFPEVREMALYEAAKKTESGVCELPVDETGFVLYNSCDDAFVLTSIQLET